MDPVRSHYVLALAQKLYAIEREIKGGGRAGETVGAAGAVVADPGGAGKMA